MPAQPRAAQGFEAQGRPAQAEAAGRHCAAAATATPGTAAARPPATASIDVSFNVFIEHTPILAPAQTIGKCANDPGANGMIRAKGDFGYTLAPVNESQSAKCLADRRIEEERTIYTAL